MQSNSSFFATLRHAFSLKRNLRSLFVRPNENFTTIDGIRGLSILWIIYFHLFVIYLVFTKGVGFEDILRDTPWYMQWIWNADKAVDSFFVISGFLISQLLFREYDKNKRLDLKKFYIRRFFRLTPVYWFSIGLYFLVSNHNTDTLWMNLFYLNNFIPFEEMAMEWTWTLAVEEQFYLLFPLFLITLFFPSKNRVRWLVGLLVLSVAIRFLIALFHDEIWQGTFTLLLNPASDMNVYFDAMYVNLYTRFAPIGCGILISYFYFYHKDALGSFVQSGAGTALSVLSVAIFLFFTFTPILDPDIEWSRTFVLTYVVFNRVLFGLAAAWLVIASLFPGFWGGLINRFLSLKVWYPVAQLSYSMYILHIMVIGFVLVNVKANIAVRGMEMADLSFWSIVLCSVIVIPVTILVSMITYTLIERPFMNLRGSRAPMKETAKVEPITQSAS